MKKFWTAVAALTMAVTCFCGCTQRDVTYQRSHPIYVNEGTPTPNPWSGQQATPETDTEGPKETPIPTPEPTYSFTGSAFIVVDAATGEVLLGSHADDRNYIASITKLLTVLTALDHLTAEDNIRVEEGWLDFFKTDGGIECYGLKAGRTYNVGDLVTMALVRSYGDAAMVLQKASEIRSGENFLDLMNEKAADLGMTASHFDNCIGLDIGNQFTENYSTAQDVTKLLRAVLTNRDIMSVCSGKAIPISGGELMTNSCSFLAEGSKSEKFSIIGGKSGSTKASGTNLALALRNSSTGDIYLCVYLHGSNLGVVSSEIRQIINYVADVADVTAVTEN